MPTVRGSRPWRAPSSPLTRATPSPGHRTCLVQAAATADRAQERRPLRRLLRPFPVRGIRTVPRRIARREDTEFHARLRREHTPVWTLKVRATHTSPTSFTALVKDQYCAVCAPRIRAGTSPAGVIPMVRTGPTSRSAPRSGMSRHVVGRRNRWVVRIAWLLLPIAFGAYGPAARSPTVDGTGKADRRNGSRRDHHRPVRSPPRPDDWPEDGRASSRHFPSATTPISSSTSPSSARSSTAMPPSTTVPRPSFSATSLRDDRRWPRQPATWARDPVRRSRRAPRGRSRRTNPNLPRSEACRGASTTASSMNSDAYRRRHLGCGSNATPVSAPRRTGLR